MGKAHLLCLGRCSHWVQICRKSKERELVRQRLAPGAEPIPTPCSPPPRRNQGARRIPCLSLCPSLLSKLPTCPARPTPPPWPNLSQNQHPAYQASTNPSSRKDCYLQEVPADPVPGVAQMTDLRAQQLAFTDNMTGPSHPWGAGSPSRQMGSLEPWLEGYKSLGLVPLAGTPAKPFHLGPDESISQMLQEC